MMLQKACKATFSAYGMDACKVMTRAWVHRMQHFYNVSLMNDDGGDSYYRPTAADRGAYLEPTEFTTLADAATGKLVERVAFVRCIPEPNL